MWNQPTKKQLAKIPNLYSNENDTVSLRDVKIHMHLFIGGTDWYVAEYDEKEDLLWGFCVLNNDLQNAEWGYASLDELKGIRVRGVDVDRDLHWEIRKASEVEQIAKAQGWKCPPRRGLAPPFT